MADEDRYHSPFCRCYECEPPDEDPGNTTSVIREEER